MKTCQRQKELQSPQQRWLKIISIMLHQNIFNICANRWLLDKILSNSQEIKLSSVLFSVRSNKIPLQGECCNALPKMIKHYRYAMSHVVNNQNNYDSVGLEAGESQKFGRQARRCTLLWLQYVCKLYCQNTSSDSNTNNNNVGNLSACVCLIRHQQHSRWGFPEEPSAEQLLW